MKNNNQQSNHKNNFVFFVPPCVNFSRKPLRLCVKIFSIALFTLVFASCPYELSRFPVLPGTIEFHPEPGAIVAVNTPLLVVYTPKYTNKYQEQVDYQWYRDGEAIPGATEPSFIPDVPGSYTVTLNAHFYEPYTSLPILVVAVVEDAPGEMPIAELPGTVSISPNVAAIGDDLTAEYSGVESVTFQWNKDGEAIPGATGQFYTPRSTGAYTVTVSAPGYASRKSGAVAVGSPDKAAGAIVGAPTWRSQTADSITINAASAPGNGQTVEYAKNTVDAVPATGWQDGLTFTGLSPGTKYYIFARAKENGTNNPGPPSEGLAVVTDFLSANMGSMAITFNGSTDRIITITKTDNGGSSITLSVNEAFDQYIWYVQGTVKSATSNSITLVVGTDFTWGDWLTLVVFEETIPWSGSFELYLE